MTETLDQLARLRATGRPVVMATLVATQGANPKREGAKLWVSDGGQLLGAVTLGGCVDPRVAAAAEAMLAEAGASPRRLTMPLGDEDAQLLGLACGGAVDVRLDRLDFGPGDRLATAYASIAEAIGREEPAALVVPFPAGDVMPDEGALVVTRDAVLGSLGDPLADAAAAAEARALLAAGRSRVIASTGAIASPLFVEVHVPAPQLVVFGAGAIAVPLVRLARVLGLRTLVVDARDRWASRERFPEADEIRVGVPSEIAASLRLGPSTLVAVVAHDYKWELPVLRHVLPSAAGYVAVLGSRRRGAALRDALAEQGLDAAALARLRVPAGLDLGAESVAEIALSILAEALAVRTGRPGGPLRDAPPRAPHGAASSGAHDPLPARRGGGVPA